jgi:hypothetical protein
MARSCRKGPARFVPIRLRAEWRRALQWPGLGETQASDADAIRKQRFVGLVVMAVDDQVGAAGLGEGVYHREAVRVAGWRFILNPAVG